ncbi:MAG: hypothetical protein H6738_07915 [Alphaproteobacteria bacterium]|nr:hypothetical protein [Alphaproteobacteria bacterium]
MRLPSFALLSAPLLALVAGCDYSGDFLFPGQVEGVDDIIVLTAPDGSQIVPANITDRDAVRANTIYAEVGPPQTTTYGGITVDFVGTGGAVCIWVDPELATWNTAVSARPDDLGRKWAVPDNIFDDGDLDLFAGLSVYYTGSPGETIGDFVVSYEDSLGNEIPLSLAACPNLTGPFGDDASAGRGSPEFCTIPATDEGIDYTILLRTWSTPLDDDRLSFAFLLAEGTCDELRTTMGSGTVEQDECVLMGEALVPEEGKAALYYGYDEAVSHSWPRSLEFEEKFCVPAGSDGDRMKPFCDAEREAVAANGGRCEWETIDDPANRCYCGDPENVPGGGAY